jgi:hypothetical protein
VDSHARLHGELTSFLRQHCLVCDQRHLVLLGWMVTGLLLSQTVCFDQWKRALPLDAPELPARCCVRSSSSGQCSAVEQVKGERGSLDSVVHSGAYH